MTFSLAEYKEMSYLSKGQHRKETVLVGVPSYNSSFRM